MQSLRARKHVTFGGRLSAEAHGRLGFVARRLEREAHAEPSAARSASGPRVRGIAAEITSAPRPA